MKIKIKSKNREKQRSKNENTNKGLLKIINDLNGSSIPKGYRELAYCPEVYTAVDKIADMISSMTLYLMENGENGDIRINNGLSHLVDISPAKYMTKKQWMKALVRCMLLEGDGNAVVKPIYEDGLIEELLIVPAGQFSIESGKDFEDGYRIQIGNKKYDPSDLIHFVLNPRSDCPYKGESFRYQLKDLAAGLSNSRDIEAKFMEGRYMPSLIVKVNTDEETIQSASGRQKTIEKFIESDNAGTPWVIPEEIIDIQQVKPLSLKDIAISDSVTNYKKTIAGLLGVPAFLLGEGQFNRDEYNTFIKDKVLSVAKVIEQTLTKQLLIKSDWYFKFNVRSLYSYDLDTKASIGASLYDKGIMTGNEVRDWIDLSPLDGLDELKILENYIPIEDIGNQKKLDNGKEADDGNETELQSDETDKGGDN